VARWYRFVQGVAFFLFRLLWGVRVEGRDNVPASGPALIASNHRSLLDPPLVGCTVPRETGFVAKRELFGVPVLGPLIRSLYAIPIDRTRLSMETMDELAGFLDTGRLLLYFPEGTRSRDGRLGRARVGVGVLLARRPVPVIPVWVEGTESPFRNLFRRGRMRIVYGVPHALPEGLEPSDPRARARALAALVLDRVRELGEAEGFIDPREAVSRPDAATSGQAEGPAIREEGMEHKE
jgi:1-acyl-sn-glycerol-3-phosphate acyltransferase